MASHIAYPNELLNDDLLDKFYENYELSDDNYYENILNTTLFNTGRSFTQLEKPLNKTDWVTHGYSAEVNAFYAFHENSIQFPAGILQGAFFNKNRPRYMNYGAIGFVIGHEITHGFDIKGRQFDENGIFVNWWEKKPEKEFFRRAQCIINQYGNYTVEELGYKLNGVNTLGENIADNGGIRVAYNAYKRWSKRNGRELKLPNIDRNQEQLFWISTANSWCGKYTPRALEILHRDVHGLSEFRIIGSFSNMEEFSKDFNCPIGSNMNPRNKCSVW